MAAAEFERSLILASRGAAIRTRGTKPAVQTGLTTRRLTFRKAFSAIIVLLACEEARSVLVRSTILIIVDDRRVHSAAPLND
jgi:hypothetical protein